MYNRFDAIAKRRGSLGGDDSGVRDSVVNQLLSKMDGVGELRNILVIALTNRKDLIDDALLRPGRFTYFNYTMIIYIGFMTVNILDLKFILKSTLRIWLEDKKFLRFNYDP
jgi:hypothetical protein